jgi:hypothetical protein
MKFFPIIKSSKYPNFPSHVPWTHAEIAFVSYRNKWLHKTLDKVASLGGWYPWQFLLLYYGFPDDC